MQTPSQLPLVDIKQKIQAANSILIILPQHQTIDAVAAGLALYLTLTQNYAEKSEQKSITIVSPTDMTVAYQRLFGVGNISKSLGSKNLVISLHVPHEAIEKVMSTNDNGQFNLVIETKEGVQKLSKKDVDFSYQGVDADLIIAMGLTTPDQAGALLSQEKNLFTDREIIIITNQPNAIPFGTVNLQDPVACGLSEMTAKIVRFLKLDIDEDSATNLLAGIEAATNNFMMKATADTFAAVSWCMRLGGKRNHLNSAGATASSDVAAPRFGFPFEGSSPFPPLAQPPQEGHTQPAFEPIPPSPFPPVATSEADQQENSTTEEEDVKPQDDWFEPKIFKTTGGVNKA